MEAQGYEVKRGKFVSFRAAGQERFTRSKTLGADYTEDAITKRIAGTATRAPRKDRNKTAITLIQQIEDIIASQQRAKNPYWTKISNLKEAAKTVNFLTENGFLHTTDFEANWAEANAAFDEAEAAIKAAEKKFSDMAMLIKHAANYQQTRHVAAGLKMARDKDAYRREHGSELIVHESAARAIKATLPGGKLPSIPVLQAEHARLTEKKTALRSECDKLKKQAREYGIIKANVERILGKDTTRIELSEFRKHDQSL